MTVPTVLVVDDNAITRKVVRVTLTAEGYRVREAATGEAALAEVTREVPDLILQDLLLPDIHGIELVGRLRALPGASTIPILAFSGFQPAAAKAHSLTAGFTDFLTKPIEPSVLVRTLASYLTMKKPATPKDSHRPRLLVADDDPIQLKLSRLQLIGAGFDVTAVVDGEAALRAALADPPDVIVSDVLMPGLDGFRLCLAVHAHPQLASVPVILQTAAFTEAADRALAASIGAAAYVLRTADSEGLVAEVFRCLAPSTEPAAAPSSLNLDSYTNSILRQVERLASINVRLTGRVSWLESERAIFGGLAEVLRGAPSVETLVDELLYRFVDAAGITFGLAYLIGPEGGLAPRSRIGLVGVSESQIQSFFGQSHLLQQVIHQGVALILPSDGVSTEQSRPVLAGLGAESVVIVPLGHRREQLGVIALASDHEHYDEDWRVFTEAVGVVIGQSIGLARTVARLRESEEQSRSVLEAVPSGVLRADRLGRFVSANAAAERILGVDRDVIFTRTIGDEAWDLRSPDDDLPLTITTSVTERTARAESIRELEFQLKRPNGGLVAISMNVEPFRDHEGRNAGGIFAITDITSRKRADGALRQRVRQQEVVARFGQFALKATSVGHLFEEAVAATSQSIEVSRVAVYALLPGTHQLTLAAGIECRERLVPGSLTLAVDRDSQVGFTILNGGPVVADDLSTETRFGVPQWLRELGIVSSISVLIPGQPAPRGVLVAKSTEPRAFQEDDVHFIGAIATTLAAAIARLQSEEAVRASEKSYRRIVETTSEGIWTIDSDEVTTYVNQQLADMLGYRVEDIVGNTLYNFMTAENARIARDSIAQQLSEGQAQFEFQFRRKDGAVVQTWVRANALTSPDGQREGALAIVTDVTARKNLESQLQQAQKMEAIGQLAGGVAHDFNNLLTAINGFSELLVNRTSLTPTQRDYVAQIIHAGGSAAGLTRQLLAFSRRQITTPRDLDLNETVGELAKMLQRIIGDDVTISVFPGPGLGTIRADVGQIEQVLLNLATNARDAMPPGGHLRIETANAEMDEEQASFFVDAKPGPYVVLSVIDSGVGMDAALQARIFEPFFTTKETGKGTGLGLAAVHGIVKQNGGSIAVTSEVGVGSTFKVYFPRVAVAEQSPESTQVLATRLRGTETILVVEDDAQLRALTRTLLAGIGYTILEAGDGAAALAVAEQYEDPIHLLLTDVVMPKLGGRILSERLSTRYPAMKVVFVSGYTDDIVVRHGVVNATVEFLQKPFSMDALRNKVRDVLDAS